MLTSLALATVLATTGQTRPNIWLPSSEAIEIARAAATEWNRRPLPRGTSFDVVDAESNSMPGYVSVLYYVGVRPLMEISINLATGQVVEPNRCLIFHGPKIRAFSSMVRRKTGVRAIPLETLANNIGCDALRRD